jgi:hypothetical protein
MRRKAVPSAHRNLSTFNQCTVQQIQFGGIQR